MKSKHIIGYTLVELLVVITVIAILAGISIVSYRGIQHWARDSQRVSDITSIQKGLMLYKSIHGRYPAHNSPSFGAWDTSADTRNGHVFMEGLISENILSAAPKDPINKTFDTVDNNDGYQYAYFTYDLDNLSGWMTGCPLDRGHLAILMVQRFESDSIRDRGPGFRCGPEGGNGDFTKNYPNAWIWGDFDRD